jgi:hypothetical protein
MEARCKAPLLRWPWWTSWTWTTTSRSTPREPICFIGWAGTARPPPPTSVRPTWPRRTPSGTSSGSVAELRAERTGDFEQVAGARLHLVAEALDGAATQVQTLRAILDVLTTTPRVSSHHSSGARGASPQAISMLVPWLPGRSSRRRSIGSGGTTATRSGSGSTLATRPSSGAWDATGTRSSRSSRPRGGRSPRPSSSPAPIGASGSSKLRSNPLRLCAAADRGRLLRSDEAPRGLAQDARGRGKLSEKETNGGERRGCTRAPLWEAALARRSFIEGLLSTRIPAALRDETLSL